MTLTTHDIQMQRYQQPYTGPEVQESQREQDVQADVLSAEIAALHLEIEMMERAIAEAEQHFMSVAELT